MLNKDSHSIMEGDSENLIKEIASDIQAKLSGENSKTLHTGIEIVDHLTQPLENGSVTVIASEPGKGKTSMAISILDKTLDSFKKRGKAVIFTFKETPTQYLMRLVSRKSEVDPQRIRDRIISIQDSKQLAEAIKSIKETPLEVVNPTAYTIDDISKRLEEINQSSQISVIVIDSLQFIRGKFRDQPREQQLSDTLREISYIAKRYNVPVLLLSDLNRSSLAENRTPDLRDLRDSGFIGSVASNVIMISSDRIDSDEFNNFYYGVRVYLIKSTTGRQGDDIMRFTPRHSSFSQIKR